MYNCMYTENSEFISYLLQTCLLVCGDETGGGGVGMEMACDFKSFFNIISVISVR